MPARTYVLLSEEKEPGRMDENQACLVGDLFPASAASAASCVGTLNKPAGNPRLCCLCMACAGRRWVLPREDPPSWAGQRRAVRRRLPAMGRLTSVHISG